MVKKEFNAEAAWKKASDLYSNKRFEDCVKVLETLVENNANPAYVCYVKATVLSEMNENDKALKELNRSLRFDPDFYISNQAKAQFLYGTYTDLEEALRCIDTAINNYTPEDLADNLGDANTLSTWIQGYVATRSEMINLKTSIENDIRSNQLYERMQSIESSVDQSLRDERHRSFEMLGIFAAIIALVLASAQSALSLKGLDFLWLGMGLVLPVSFLLILVSPRIEGRVKGLLLIVGVACSGGVVGYLVGAS